MDFKLYVYTFAIILYQALAGTCRQKKLKTYPYINITTPLLEYNDNSGWSFAIIFGQTYAY